MKAFYTQSSQNASLTDPYTYTPSNEQAAWFAIVHTAANIDGVISEEERSSFCKLIAIKELFRGHEILDYYHELLAVKDKLKPEEIIRQAAKIIKPEHAPTLFSIVTETLLTKGFLTEQEDEFLSFIERKLDLDKNLSSKIIEVLLLKNKWNCIYN